MNRIVSACLAVAGLMAPAHAATLPSGETLITQAAVNAGSITPGDTPGFPVTISVGGSYRLASNLTVTTAVNGIEVRANEVTIDMGGFTLAGSGAGRNGVTSFNRALRVMNGNVRGFTNDGIRSTAQFLLVDHVLVTANGRLGVFADAQGTDHAADYASILNSRVAANNNQGINCTNHCRVENSIISGNASTGITILGAGGLVLGNNISGNNSHGVSFGQPGGAGNNIITENSGQPFIGPVIHLQPNACSPACLPPP